MALPRKLSASIFLFSAGCAWLLSGWPAQGAEPVPGIGPAGKVQRLHTGFGFTEGPADDGHGNLYFSDIPNARIHKLDAHGKLSVFTNQSRHANGLMFNQAGELVVCEMDGQLAVWNVETKTRRVLVDGYQGVRFNAPNDLVIDRTGGVYFTDPHFRAPQPLPQGKTCVYYVSPAGNVTRLVDDLPAPNGVILSPDEQTLYVFPSGQPVMRAYPVREPGKLGPGRDFCTLKLAGRAGLRGADGSTVDVDGNLYLATQLGVQVFNSQGEALGILEFPEQPANLTFGGPNRTTLFVTARTSLYAVSMFIRGPREGR